jgi:hypothetical protein
VVIGWRFATQQRRLSSIAKATVSVSLTQEPEGQRVGDHAVSGSRSGRRLLHTPIRNPVHQLVGGITPADDTRVGLQLGEEAHSRTYLDTVSHPH